MGDWVFEGEVGQVGVEIERAFAVLMERNCVRACLERRAFDDEGIVEREQVCGSDRDLLPGLAVEGDGDGHFGPVLAAGLQVIGERLDAERGVACGIPVVAMLAIIEHVLDQTGRELAFGIRAA